MNGKQKVVVLLGILLVVLMGFYPPWLYTIDFRRGDLSVRAESPAGYHLIFNPPPLPSGTYGEDNPHLARVVQRQLQMLGSTRLNHLCLLVQWLGVVIVVGGLVSVLAERKP